MQQVDEQTGAPQVTISRWVVNAAAINLVLASAWLVAGMIFAVDLGMAAVLALGFSVLTWACAALVLVPVWLVSLARRPGQETSADPLHDSWLDQSS
jgi:hypothetical protein